MEIVRKSFTLVIRIARRKGRAWLLHGAQLMIDLIVVDDRCCLSHVGSRVLNSMKYIDYQWHKEVQKRREEQNKSRNNAHTNKGDSDYFILIVRSGE